MMKEETKGILLLVGFLIAVIALIVSISLVIWIQSSSTEHVILTARVVNVTIENDNLYYPIVTFDNGQSYKIGNFGVNKIEDFTMHSKWIIELSRPYSVFGGASDYWVVDNLIKVP